MNELIYPRHNGTEMEEGASLRADHKTTLMLAWPGSRDLVFKFWEPLKFLVNRAIRFKFGTQIQDGPFHRMHNKLSCVGWAVVDLFSHDTCKTAN